MALESHFLADVHLPLPSGASTRRFVRYLRCCHPPQVQQIFLLGDVFHYWIHRSSKIESGYAEVLDELRQTAERGITVHFFPGNRDFLLGRSLLDEQAPRLQFHDQRLVVDLGARRVCVSHGDDLCVNDWAYVLWRKFVRSRVTVSFFDCLPESWRDWLVERLSRASRQRSDRKSLKVPRRAYRAIFQSGVDVIIHGHLHLAGHTTFQDPPGEVWSLPDWDQGSQVLVYDHGADRFELRTIEQ